jgi:hypothetical protein
MPSVIISEFMAANSRTVTNSLGQTGDWIELRNAGVSTVNLAGWYLTDATNNLTKWKFPSVSMAAGAYLLVWADDANIVTNGEIHASFKLSAEGEYLALVRPDGTTVEHEYAPQFPEQDDDISYGVDLLDNGADVTLIPSQADCRIRVPTNFIGPWWRNRTFNDNSWTNAATGVGFEVAGSMYENNINTDVETAMYNRMASVYVRIPFVTADPADYTALRLNIRFDDGFVAFLNGVEIARSNAPISLPWNASATAGRNPSAALISSTFPITDVPASLLVSGTNVLAIHGLNFGTGNSNALIQPVLEGTLANGVTVEQRRYYAQPTPGTNNSDAFMGFVGDTTFSADRGFYSSPFTVAISCKTGGAAIRYTLDGSTPTDVHGMLYTGPIPINTTTVLRAVAYKTGWKSSDVDTHTYIFADAVLNQPAAPPGWPSQWTNTGGAEIYGEMARYSDYEMDPEVIYAPNNLANNIRSGLTNIPTLSLVTDLPNLFDPVDGIYVRPREEGVLWERPVSAEWINPDGSKGFQVNCGLRIQGASSRGPNATPKHSMRLLFKSVYGPSKLNFKMFPDTTVDSFNSIHLRAEYDCTWTHWDGIQRPFAQYNQDQFARDVQLAMGHETVHGNVFHLYINGLYWGLYHPGERPDASYAVSHFGGNEEEWDALNAGEPIDGDTAAWDAMWVIANGGLSSLSAYNNFRQYCDVENFADYMILMHYVDNLDWDYANWYAVRKRESGAQFKFLCWDSEASLVDATDNRLTVNYPNRPSALFQKAIASPEFKLLLADRLHKHLFNNGVLTPAGATNLWIQRSAVIDKVIAAESARWGDHRRDTWQRDPPYVLYTPDGYYYPEQNRLLTQFFPLRTTNVVQQYKAAGLYPSLNAPELSVHGGFFSNSITVSISGANTIYYTLDGTDPRQYGTGTAVGTSYSGAITLTNSTRLKARARNGNTWSALLEADFLDVAPNPLRISELMYAPRPPSGTELNVNSNASAFSFVEIHNGSTRKVGLVGVSFADGIEFDFSKGTNLSLAAGGYVVLVKDPAAFAVRYPSVSASKIAGEFRGDLVAEGGEGLKLSVQGVGDVSSFEYSDGRGWPLAADGVGHSLIPLVVTDQSSGQLSYGGNWKASVNVDGSPGAAEPSPFSCICINEIAAHTDYTNPGYPEYDSNDWIELLNCSGSTMSLNGFYLSDDPMNLKKWAIPAGTNLAAGQRIVFDEVTGFHSPITNGFGIDKAGEQILLSYASGSGPASVVDAIEFKGQENGRTVGRYPDGSGDWFVCLPTPVASNVRAGQEPVLSEIMYHPPDMIPGIDNTEHEYVEIYNPTTQPVNLWNVDGSWRLTGQVEFTFANNTVLTAASRALIVPFNPVTNVAAKAAFLAQYGLPGSVTLFGPFNGNLSNQGGRLALERPQAGDLPGEGVSWVIVDETYYFDETPWMTSADGFGQSLHRTAVDGAGRNPASWSAGSPSPGSGSATIPDFALSISRAAGQLALNFNLTPGIGYVIETRTNLTLGSWQIYTSVTNPTTQYLINLPGNVSPVFFRMRTE